MHCPWCGTDAEEAAARDEGPHLKWCVDWRDPGLPEGMTVEVRGSRREYHYRAPRGAPLAGTTPTLMTPR